MEVERASYVVLFNVFTIKVNKAGTGSGRVIIPQKDTQMTGLAASPRPCLLLPESKLPNTIVITIFRVYKTSIQVAGAVTARRTGKASPPTQ